MRAPPRESSFARCHPLVTFSYFAALLVASVFSLHPLLLGLTFCSALLYALSQRGAAALRLALLFLLPAVALTALVNPLFNHRGATVLFYLADNPMTAEAFLYGLATGVLMGGILLWFSCMGPLFRSDKIVYLFGRVSPSLALTLSICLRFVPLLKARFAEVSMGQRCLGRGGQGGPLARLQVFGRELSILLSWSLEAAIALERRMLSPLRERAAHIIDTSGLTARGLRAKLLQLFARGAAERSMEVRVTSFGFKHGIPMEADLVFDVRFLPNPYYVAELRPRTGLDDGVRDYALSAPQSQEFLRRLTDFVTYLLPRYVEEGKTSLTIAVGCTGGRHRSVAVAHALAEAVRQEGYPVGEVHRDLGRI